MGFKSDWEFLRNVTVGAVGARHVIRLLNHAGFQLIGTDRSAVSNKIWATKVKRLRVPDLLCLRSGVRVECRAKGELAIKMSHATANPERAWDNGLRDHDLVAFIRCFSAGDVQWHPSDQIALFRVGDLRATRELAKESRMKAASEGSEIYLEWPSIVPKSPGLVENVGADQIVTRLQTGRKQTYRLQRGLVHLRPHVRSGDRFGAGDRIIASVLPAMVETVTFPATPYDFVSELDGQDRATVFCAAKAFGFLPEVGRRSSAKIQAVMETHGEPLVRLEAAGSLARLGVAEGWCYLQSAAVTVGDDGFRMEATLVLGELGDERALAILSELAMGVEHPGELRSAAVWGMGNAGSPMAKTALLAAVVDSDEDAASHAIVSLSRWVNENSVDGLIAQLGPDDRLSAAICKAIELSRVRPLDTVVTELLRSSGGRRAWLLYLLALFGRQTSASHVAKHAPQLLEQLEFFWRHHGENWTNRLDIADRLEFLAIQDRPEA